MPFYIISVGTDEVCCCQEENLESVQEGATKILDRPLVDLRIKEVSEGQAEAWAEDWLECRARPEDICPICNGHRASVLAGDIILKECKLCGFKS